MSYPLFSITRRPDVLFEQGAYEGTVIVVKESITAGVSGTFVNLFATDFQAAFGTRVLTEKDFGYITP
ncbi:MAG: hypothetical protein NXY57DRAFT_79080 [Lentinula lateritia]|nr:MAG: hypothetical protein NXY57DRAFT_79080 [Lentinula lateritia]